MVIRIESYSSILQRTSVGSDRLALLDPWAQVWKKGNRLPVVGLLAGGGGHWPEEEKCSRGGDFFFPSFFSILQDSSKLYFWAAGFSLPPHFTVTFFLTQMWKKKKINLFLNFFLCVGCYSAGDFKKEEETPERWLDIKIKKKKTHFQGARAS